MIIMVNLERAYFWRNHVPILSYGDVYMSMMSGGDEMILGNPCPCSWTKFCIPVQICRCSSISNSFIQSITLMHGCFYVNYQLLCIVCFLSAKNTQDIWLNSCATKTSNGMHCQYTTRCSAARGPRSHTDGTAKILVLNS